MARQHQDLLDPTLLQVLQGVQGRGAEAILQLLGAEVGVGAKAEAGDCWRLVNACRKVPGLWFTCA